MRLVPKLSKLSRQTTSAIELSATMNQREIKFLRPDHSDPTPKYLQIARKMEKFIESDQWEADQGLPSERQLVDLLDVSRVTARRALKVITDKGLVVRRPGSGTFVAPRLDQPLSHLSSFSEELKLRGIHSTSSWLVRDIALANAHELMSLGLSRGAKVARLKRIRLADDSPLAIEYCRVPADLLPDPTAIQGSLYEWLDQNDSPVVRALQTIRARKASPEQAELLEMPPGDALLFVTRIGYGRDGKPMELTESFCHPERYDFVAELSRTPSRKDNGA